MSAWDVQNQGLVWQGAQLTSGGCLTAETATTLLARLKHRRDDIRNQLASVERLKGELVQLEAMIAAASEGK